MSFFFSNVSSNYYYYIKQGSFNIQLLLHCVILLTNVFSGISTYNKLFVFHSFHYRIYNFIKLRQWNIFNILFSVSHTCTTRNTSQNYAARFCLHIESQLGIVHNRIFSNKYWYPTMYGIELILNVHFSGNTINI